MAQITQKAFNNNRVVLDQTPNRIISVTQKGSGKSFGTGLFDYTIENNTIVFKKAYDEITVIYESSIAGEREIATEKQLLNTRLGKTITSTVIPSLKATAAKSQSKAASLNQSELSKIVGALASGFQSIGEDFRENIGTTDEPSPAILRQDPSASIGIKKTCALKGALSIFAGSSVNDGFLNASVGSSDPAGIKASLEGLLELVTPTAQDLEAVLASVSSLPDLVGEASLSDPINEITQASQVASTQIDRKLNNPISKPGISFMNLLVSALNTVKSEAPVSQINTSVVSQRIDENGRTVNFNLVDEKSNTSLSEAITQSDASYIPSTVDVYDINSNSFKWFGGLTDLDTYVFEPVDTLEELEAELINTKRELTGTVIHWTRTHTDQFITARDLHLRDLQRQNRALGKDYSIYAKEAGIQYHYIVLRNGTVQRGRPLSKTGLTGTAWAKRGIHIAFVAGYNSPAGTPNYEQTLSSASITEQQWLSFEQVLKTLYKVYPGMSVVGHNDVNPVSTCPGFNVIAYTESNFNKSVVYDDVAKYDEAFTTEEQVNRLSKKIIKETEGATGPLLSLAEKLKGAFAQTDPITGEQKIPTPTELLQDARDYEQFKEESLKNLTQIEKEITKAITENGLDDALRDASNAIKTALESELNITENATIKSRKNLLNANATYNSIAGWEDLP